MPVISCSGVGPIRAKVPMHLQPWDRGRASQRHPRSKPLLVLLLTPPQSWRCRGKLPLLSWLLALSRKPCIPSVGFQSRGGRYSLFSTIQRFPTLNNTFFSPHFWQDIDLNVFGDIWRGKKISCYQMMHIGDVNSNRKPCSVTTSSDGLIFVKRQAKEGRFFSKNTGVIRAKRRAKFKLCI